MKYTTNSNYSRTTSLVSPDICTLQVSKLANEGPKKDPDRERKLVHVYLLEIEA